MDHGVLPEVGDRVGGAFSKPEPLTRLEAQGVGQGGRLDSMWDRAMTGAYAGRIVVVLWGPVAKPASIVDYSAAVGSLSRSQLDALVEEASVDCYNEAEQLTGLFTMIEDNIALPFVTQVLGVEVTVRKVDLVDDRIVAICHRDRQRQSIDILDLPLPDPPPGGVKWIAAYRHWGG
jgi:hypothetical protein